MENVLKNYKGVILFYLFLILCVVIVNARFETLNNEQDTNNNMIALSDK